MNSNKKIQNCEYLLGLDIGSASIGWSVVRVDNQQPVELLAAGSRIFDAGVEGNIEEGKDTPKTADRREKRLARRQHWRRAQRKRKVLLKLQECQLLPETPSPENEEDCEEERRHRMIVELDQELLKKHNLLDDHQKAQLLPYQLRANAANEKVTLFELGRALYHIGQRRGYLSNRKTDAAEVNAEESSQKKKDDSRGVVLKGIGELRDAMGDKTLGEHFASLSPFERRIRQRWTARAMYIEEFNKIWELQSSFHQCLTPEIRKTIYNAIFYQRPLKSQKGLIGKCELEVGKRRAAVALPVNQDFRILQAVNHLTLVEPDSTSRPLTISEKGIVYEALQDVAELTYAKVRKLLGCHKKAKFSIEEGGEKRIIGNRTRAKLQPVFGDRWDEMLPQEQEDIVYDLLSFQKADALERHAKKMWELDSKQAKQISEVFLEEGYASHSKLAIKKLSSVMRDGKAYSTARKEVYPESFETKEVYEKLPPVKKAFPELRNPAVERALTELRKLVNHIVREYGIPSRVRIETARELKKSKKERMSVVKKNRENEKRRGNARVKILKELGIENPSRWDIEKVLLADECNWECPYTGKKINMRNLLGSESQFDVEHIFPRRFLDNSYINKTLCYQHENRHGKQDRLPFEAYSHDEEKWNEILNRVRAFNGSVAWIKLKRFLAEKVPEGFSNRQLNDTRYASTLAGDYLAMFYGGRVDENSTLRVETNTGGVTHHLRREWQLESLLGGSKKNRDDHRHHAIDALVIALTDVGMVQRLANAAEEASQLGTRLMFAPVKPPWENFVESVQPIIDNIKVSFRAKRKLAGALEAGSNYSKAYVDKKGKATYRIRKPVSRLSKGELERIVDPRIKQAVLSKMEQLGAKDTKVFEVAENCPFITAKDGRKIPIYKVRIQITGNPRTIGKGVRKRNVLSGKGSNHHAIVVFYRDKKGNEKWEHHVVTRMEANRRLSKEGRAEGVPVFQKDWGPDKKFLFSICANDYIEADGEEDGERILYRVSILSAKQIQLWEHNQANTKSGDRICGLYGNCIQSTDNLRKRNARKVHVTPLGKIIPAGD